MGMDQKWVMAGVFGFAAFIITIPIMILIVFGMWQVVIGMLVGILYGIFIGAVFAMASFLAGINIG